MLALFTRFSSYFVIFDYFYNIFIHFCENLSNCNIIFDDFHDVFIFSFFFIFQIVFMKALTIYLKFSKIFMNFWPFLWFLHHLKVLATFLTICMIFDVFFLVKNYWFYEIFESFKRFSWFPIIFLLSTRRKMLQIRAVFFCTLLNEFEKICFKKSCYKACVNDERVWICTKINIIVKNCFLHKIV